MKKTLTWPHNRLRCIGELVWTEVYEPYSPSGHLGSFLDLNSSSGLGGGGGGTECRISHSVAPSQLAIKTKMAA